MVAANSATTVSPNMEDGVLKHDRFHEEHVDHNSMSVQELMFLRTYMKAC